MRTAPQVSQRAMVIEVEGRRLGLYDIDHEGEVAQGVFDHARDVDLECAAPAEVGFDELKEHVEPTRQEFPY